MRYGYPLSLQQLLHDGRRMELLDLLDRPMDLQLVLLSIDDHKSSVGQAAQFELLDAAFHGRAAVVRSLLEAGTDKDATSC